MRNAFFNVMPRKSTPSFVVEIPLQVTPGDERQLLATFEAAKRVYNTVLQAGLKSVQAMRADPAWATAKAMPHKLDEERKARSEAYIAVRKAHGFTDSAFQALAIECKNAGGFSSRLGSHITQKLGTRVFKALDEWIYNQRGQPRFKGLKRPLHSIEGKNDAAAPRWDYENLFLVLARD
jgi:putative transposase